MARSSRSIAGVRPRTGVSLVVGSAVLLATMLQGTPATGAASRPGAAERAGSTPQSRGAAITYFFVPSLHSRPFSIAPGPDGNLWFTDTDASMIGRITPSGVVTEFDIGAGKKPYAIVAAADGNLWFTEMLNDKIGVVDTDGNLIHEYFAPGIDARPAGITAAPNGDVWFTEMGSGEDITDDVGRAQLDGTVTTYNLYPCACFPIGITTGADGNLWAAEEEGVDNGTAPGTIDRMSPDGQTIDRYPIPIGPLDPGHLPAFVAPGPDGNVWFTEYAADLHLFGKVTPNGVVTEYPLPGTSTNSVGITTGTDGRLWVTQGDANDIVVARPNGAVVTTYPTHHLPAGITIGPDGNMWFTSALDGEIGRIHTARHGFAYVLDIAPGFTPATRAVPLGTTVEWVLEAPGMHRVKDATGLSLYDSGAKPPVSFLQFAFTAAGSYRYTDPGAGSKGTVTVPVTAPSTGQVGVAFPVTWASAPPTVGLVLDVQVQVPGSSDWQPWQTGVTGTAADYTAGATGTTSFRARLRNPAAHTASGWSPPRGVVVS